jgi:hypothetical protein
MAKTAEEIKAQLRAKREADAKERSVSSAETGGAVAQSNAEGSNPSSPTNNLNAVPVLAEKYTHDEKRAGALPAGRQLPAHPSKRERQQPHALGAEKGILCGILQRPAVVVPIAQQSLGPDHFYDPQNRAIFEHACNFFNDEGGFDMVTLMEHLLGAGHINSVGGPGYFNEVLTFGAIPENAAQYIEILNDKYGARRLIKLSDDIGRQAYEIGDSAIGGPADILDELYVGLDQIRSGLRSNLRLPELRDVSLFLGDNQPKEPPELVKHVLHQGSKIIVGGTSKGWKTMTLIDLAVSVATGSPWWGFETVQGPVCYINFEIQEPFMCKRVNAVCKAKGVTLQPDQFMVWNLRGHGEGIENIVADLMAVLRHRKFALIVIDPIYKALGDRDENKAGDVASMLNQLEKIAVKTGAAVAFGAHYSKGNQALKESVDRIGGSGVFARDPDSILTMTAHEEPGAFTVEATLRNFPPIEPFVVKQAWPLFYRDNELDPTQLRQARTNTSGQFKPKYSTDMLLDQLSIVHGLKPTEALRILKSSEGMSNETLHRLKRELIAQKKLTIKDGLWFRTPEKENQ